MSNVKRVYCEYVNSARLKVVPQVVVRDHQHHPTGVAFLSVQLHEDFGVGAGPADVACLYCYVIANIYKQRVARVTGQRSQITHKQSGKQVH